MNAWDKLPREQYVSLAPWVWVQLVSDRPPGPFPFIGGVAPEVVASLHEAHSSLLSCVETAISDVFARRARLDDPLTTQRLEDAYAELVHSRPHLAAFIKCGRKPDGAFQWEFPFDPTKSSTVVNTGLRVFHAVKRQAIPFPFERPMGPLVGKFVGLLTGTHRTGELRTVAASSGRDGERVLNRLMELFIQYDCLLTSERSTVRDRWLETTKDRDAVHLGHAAVMYRRQESFLLFDPWPQFLQQSDRLSISQARGQVRPCPPRLPIGRRRTFPERRQQRRGNPLGQPMRGEPRPVRAGR